MSETRAIISLYIKGGKEKMSSYVESSFAKKKGKRGSAVQEEIEMNPSIFNFITVKPFKHTFDYFSKEMVNSLEGKTRSNNMFKSDDQDLDIKDINSFKVLYNKYLAAPNTNWNGKDEQKMLSKNLEIKAGQHIFKNELENSQITQSIDKLGRVIEQNKHQVRENSKNLFRKVEFDIMTHRTTIDCFEYYHQIRNSLEDTAKFALNINHSLIRDSEEFQDILKKNIIIAIHKWFNQLLQSLNLSDMMIRPSIMVDWGSNLLMAQKQQLFAQQISGKLLFNVEQTINKLKEATSPLDYSRQFHLRQKKYGVSNPISGNFTRVVDKSKGKTQKMSLLAFAQKQAIKESANSQEQYSKVANRVNNLRRLKSPQIQVQQSRPKSKVHDSSQRFQGKFFSKYADIRKKLTPLKQKDMDKFQYKKDPKPSQPSQPSQPPKPPSRIPLRNQNNSPNLLKSKIEIKFPLKIGPFEMYSWSESSLCYQIEEINLKELPLKFIKDRLKFGENKVKIQYPCNPKQSVAQIVCKSLQILNSLGAEICCQEQSSYKATHDIDSSEILAVSWLVEKPVRDIIKLYGEYFTSCQTKK